MLNVTCNLYVILMLLLWILQDYGDGDNTLDDTSSFDMESTECGNPEQNMSVESNCISSCSWQW